MSEQSQDNYDPFPSGATEPAQPASNPDAVFDKPASNPNLGYYKAKVTSVGIGLAKTGTPFLEVSGRTYERSINAKEHKGPYKAQLPAVQIDFTASQPLTTKTIDGKSVANLIKALGFKGTARAFAEDPSVFDDDQPTSPVGRKLIVECKEETSDRGTQEQWRVLWSAADGGSRFKKVSGGDAKAALAALSGKGGYDPTADEDDKAAEQTQ